MSKIAEPAINQKVPSSLQKTAPERRAKVMMPATLNIHLELASMRR
jgi:hypothetical protein